MQALSEIITHKLKFMAHYEQQQKMLDSQQLIELLLKEKKKESINQVIQNRLVQTILSRRIQAPYSVQDFLNKSMALMKLCSPDFQYYDPHLDVYTQIVETYIAFFNHNSCQLRSQEIAHVFYKRLCERSMLLPTLFNWFNQWTRKRYNSFLKINLIKINQAKRQKQGTQMLQKSLSPHKRVLSPSKRVLRSELEDGKVKIFKEEYTVKVNHIIDTLPKEPLRNPLLQPYRSLVLGSPSRASRSMRSAGSQENSLQISPQKQRREKSSKNIKKQWPNDQNLIVNRDTFCGAYNEEAQIVYSQFSGIIADLDMNYIKGVRKNDRKAEYSLKIKQIAGVFARHQGQIRKSIQDYFVSYSIRFSSVHRLKSSKKENRGEKRTVKRKKMSLWEDGISENKIVQQQQQVQLQAKLAKGQRSMILKKSQSNQNLQSRIKMTDNQSMLRNHRTIELRLPELPEIKNKDVQQLKNNLMTKRKQRYPNSVHVSLHIKHIKNASTDLSVEIRREIRQMNKLYKDQQKKQVKSPNVNPIMNLYQNSNQPELAFGKYQSRIDRQALLKEFKALGRKSLNTKKSIKRVDGLEQPTNRNSKQQKGIFYFPRLSK